LSHLWRREQEGFAYFACWLQWTQERIHKPTLMGRGGGGGGGGGVKSVAPALSRLRAFLLEKRSCASSTATTTTTSGGSRSTSPVAPPPLFVVLQSAQQQKQGGSFNGGEGAVAAVESVGTKGLRALALLGAGVTGMFGLAGLAYADEAEHGLSAPDYPWPHNGILSSYDHASIRRGHKVKTPFRTRSRTRSRARSRTWSIRFLLAQIVVVLVSELLASFSWTALWRMETSKGGTDGQTFSFNERLNVSDLSDRSAWLRSRSAGHGVCRALVVTCVVIIPAV
jgi:hypothetical protein